MEGRVSAGAATNSIRSQTLMRISLPLAALLLLGGSVQAQLIYLKDGFTINGKVRKEQIVVGDPLSGDAYTYTKAYHVDDGPRRFYFSPAQMQRIDEAFNRAEDTVK